MEMGPNSQTKLGVWLWLCPKSGLQSVRKDRAKEQRWASPGWGGLEAGHRAAVRSRGKMRTDVTCDLSRAALPPGQRTLWEHRSLPVRLLRQSAYTDARERCSSSLW